MQSVSADSQPSAPRTSDCANLRSLFKGLFFSPLTDNSVLTRSGCWQSEQRSTLRLSPSTTIDLLCIKPTQRLNYLRCYLIVATSIVPHFVVKYKHMQEPAVQVTVDETGDGRKKKEKKNQGFYKRCQWLTWSGNIYFLHCDEQHKEPFSNVRKFWNISF